MSPTLTRRSVYAITASAMMIGLPTTAISSTEAPPLSHTMVLSGLENPWDMAFLPDQGMMIPNAADLR